MDATLRILFPWPVSTAPRDGDLLYGCVESSQHHDDPKPRKSQTLIILGFSKAASSEALADALRSIRALDPSLENSLSNCGGQLGVYGCWGGKQGSHARDHELWISCEAETVSGRPRVSNVVHQGACSRVHVVFYKPPVVGEWHLAVDSKEAWSRAIAGASDRPQSQQDRFPLDHAVEIINLAPHLDGKIRQRLDGVHLSSANPFEHRSRRFHRVPASLSSSKGSFSETGRHICAMVGAAKPVQTLPSNAASENCAMISRWHFWFTVGVQWLMGSLLCILLFHTSPNISSFSGSIPVFRGFMHEHIAWLSGAPAGIKLHLELAELYAWASTVVTEFSITGFYAIAPYVPMAVGFVSICSCLGGVGLGLAMICDCLAIIAIPVITLHTGMSIVYSNQLKFLGITWKLLRGRHSSRGRKLKQRRNRRRLNEQDEAGVDADQNPPGQDKKKKDDEVLMEHLIVGVLLFTPLLALLPTTLVFYVFFLALYLCIAITSFLLNIVSDVLLANPLFFLVCRIARPGLLPGGFRMVGLQSSQLGIDGKQMSSSDSTVKCCYFELQSLPAPWGQFPAFAADLIFRRRSPSVSFENCKLMCVGKLVAWRRKVRLIHTL
ncbi:hypothetical protein BSKO_02043 [Bryopsis sp. KO-2023]|nr:hypothetical protein BSKO_02043 [Bryopsis sp. KO-2023]